MKFKLNEFHLFLLALTIVFIIFHLFGSSVVNDYNSIKVGRVVSVQSTGKYTKFIKNYEVVVEFEDNKSLVTLNSRTVSDEVLFEVYNIAKDNLEEELNFKVKVLEYDDGIERYQVEGLSFAIDEK